MHKPSTTKSANSKVKSDNSDEVTSVGGSTVDSEKLYDNDLKKCTKKLSKVAKSGVILPLGVVPPRPDSRDIPTAPLISWHGLSDSAYLLGTRHLTV